MKPVIGITSSMDGESVKVGQAYISAVECSGAIPLVLPVSKSVVECAEIADGFLFTGGGDIAPDFYGEDIFSASLAFKPERRQRVEFELSLLGEIFKRSKPVLAVCYGMQLLNVFHGGSVIFDISAYGEEYLDHSSGWHSVSVIKEIAACPKGLYTVNSSHHQAIGRVGEGMAVFAESEDGIIEGIYKRDYNCCIGVQWHPERIFTEPLSEKLFKYVIGRAACIRRLR